MVEKETGYEGYYISYNWCFRIYSHFCVILNYIKDVCW